jgi:hypothetical protein
VPPDYEAILNRCLQEFSPSALLDDGLTLIRIDIDDSEQA